MSMILLNIERLSLATLLALVFTVFVNLLVPQIAQASGGYGMTERQIRALHKDFTTLESMQLTENQFVEKLVPRIQAVGPTPAKNPGEFRTRLAQHIFQAASAYGIDPLIFAGLIEQESQYDPHAYSNFGAGLTQMTSMGLAEISYQHAKDDVGAAYAELAAGYFTKRDQLSKWLEWASLVPRQKNLSVKAMQQFFNKHKRQKLPGNLSYQLAAGASLFKFYLVRANGDYRKALSSFNTVYSNYPQKVLNRVNKLGDIQF